MPGIYVLTQTREKQREQKYLLGMTEEVATKKMSEKHVEGNEIKKRVNG